MRWKPALEANPWSFSGTKAPIPTPFPTCRGWGSPQPPLNQICGTANQGAIKIYLLFIISKLPACCLVESGKLWVLLTHGKSVVWCPANPKFVFIALILKLCLSNYIRALMKKCRIKVNAAECWKFAGWKHHCVPWDWVCCWDRTWFNPEIYRWGCGR